MRDDAPNASKPVPATSRDDPDDLPIPIPLPANAARVLEVAARAALAGVGGAIATVVERHGSTPGTPGQKLYLGADGTCVGSVGGGAVERVVLAILAPLAARGGAHEMRTFRLGAELGMCCGGRVSVLVEPISGLVPCLVVGAGHIATAAAPLLAKVGFAVTVVDAREAWAAEGRIPDVRCEVGEFDEVGRDIDPSGACLVMTHDHALDQRVVEWAIARGFGFVGGVGSRAKATRVRQRLEAKGVAEADRERVRMPLGVEIGARSPDEIAISVVAEMIAWKKARESASGAPNPKTRPCGDSDSD